MSLRFPAVFLGIATILGLASFASALQDPAAPPASSKQKAAGVARTGDAPVEKTGDVPAAKTGDVPADKAKEKEKEKPKLETATFGGGCFWCLEAFFEQLKGVKSVVSGYAGGTTPKPSYEMVCSGLTGHAEVVEITFDPEVLTYDDLLEVFWICHDPTTLNAQGPDHGTQYRSIILYHDAAQKEAANKSYERVTAAKYYPDPIVTQLVPFTKFWPAEKYHQDYYRRNKSASYCQMVISPKLQELKYKLNAKANAKASETKKP